MIYSIGKDLSGTLGGKFGAPDSITNEDIVVFTGENSREIPQVIALANSCYAPLVYIGNNQEIKDRIIGGCSLYFFAKSTPTIDEITTAITNNAYGEMNVSGTSSKRSRSTVVEEVKTPVIEPIVEETKTSE